MKKTDLDKNIGLKIHSRLKQAGTPTRFGKGVEEVQGRREQRKRDQLLGLVPFAVKLDGMLVKQLHTLAQTRQIGLNEVVTELLKKGLDK